MRTRTQPWEVPCIGPESEPWGKVNREYGGRKSAASSSNSVVQAASQDSKLTQVIGSGQSLGLGLLARQARPLRVASEERDEGGSLSLSLSPRLCLAPDACGRLRLRVVVAVALARAAVPSPSRTHQTGTPTATATAIQFRVKSASLALTRDRR